MITSDQPTNQTGPSKWGAELASRAQTRYALVLYLSGPPSREFGPSRALWHCWPPFRLLLPGLVIFNRLVMLTFGLA